MIRKVLFSVFCIGLLSLSSCRDKGSICSKKEKEIKKQECFRCVKPAVPRKPKKIMTRDEAYIKLREQDTKKEKKVMTRDEAYIKLREKKA